MTTEIPPSPSPFSPTYQAFMDALWELAVLQNDFDCSSREYHKWRKQVDELAELLTEEESEEAYWYSLEIDKILMGRTDDEGTTEEGIGESASGSDP